jgi:hypothetical protein
VSIIKRVVIWQEEGAVSSRAGLLRVIAEQPPPREKQNLTEKRNSWSKHFSSP